MKFMPRASGRGEGCGAKKNLNCITGRIQPFKSGRWVEVTNGINGGCYGIHVDLAYRDRLRKDAGRWMKPV